MKDKNDNNWDLVIEPDRHLLDIPFKQIISYFDLLVLFVKRDIVVVYKQTVLGPLWFFIQPIMTTVIYVFVFGKIANLSTDGIPKPLFYLSGVIFWNFFSECFIKTSTTFTTNAIMFGKVYFPRLIVPLSVIVSNGIKFLIQFCLFLALYAYYSIDAGAILATKYLVLVPYMLALMAILGLGFGILFSSLTTKYKDLTFLIAFGVQLLMYATPVIYPMSSIPGKLKTVMWFNPLSHILETFKLAFLGRGEFSVSGLIYSSVFAILAFTIGLIIFNKTEQSFMDTV